MFKAFHESFTVRPVVVGGSTASAHGASSLSSPNSNHMVNSLTSQPTSATTKKIPTPQRNAQPLAVKRRKKATATSSLADHPLAAAIAHHNMKMQAAGYSKPSGEPNASGSRPLRSVSINQSIINSNPSASDGLPSKHSARRLAPIAEESDEELMTEMGQSGLSGFDCVVMALAGDADASCCSASPIRGF